MASIYLRKKVFWVSYYENGKKTQRSLHVKTKKVALHLKKELEIKLDKGIAGFQTKKKLKDFFEEYKKYAVTKKCKMVFDTETRALERFFNSNNFRTLNDITTRLIQEYLSSLPSSLAPSYINHQRKHIHTFLNVAVKQNHLQANPASNVEKHKVKPKKLRFFSNEEIERLIGASKDHYLFPMIMTALYTGMRVSEIRKLKWEDINFGFDVIRVKETKTGKPRLIPLSPRLKAILSPLRQAGGVIFTFDGKPYSQRPREPFIAILQKAKIEISRDTKWHCLRRTFASHHVIKGTSIAKVATWLGHANIQMTYSKYASLAPAYDSDIEALKF